MAGRGRSFLAVADLICQERQSHGRFFGITFRGRTKGPRSNFQTASYRISISTALLVGVPLPSAWLPAGTNTFASGKYAAALPRGIS